MRILHAGRVAVKIPYRGFEISLAFDDSCQGTGLNMFRSYLKVFKGDEDITQTLFGEKELYSLQEWHIPHAYDMINQFIDKPW